LFSLRLKKVKADAIVKEDFLIKRMQNNYYILRHGQTPYQMKEEKNTYSWPEHTPIRLTAKGEAEIKESAKKLKGAGIDLIYCSDTTRTKQSAKIMAKELGIEKVITDARLRDINIGVYGGGPKQKFYQDFPNNIERFTKTPEGGENWDDCKKRMLDFIEEIDRKHKQKNILIVSHGDPLMLLEGALQGLSDEEILKKRMEDHFIKTGELRRIKT